MKPFAAIGTCLGSWSAAVILSGSPGRADAAAAMMVSDDNVRLNLGLELQTRLEHASATAPDGSDWDVVRARPGVSSDIDWSLPRARVSLTGSYGLDYRFGVTLRDDHVDGGGNASNRGMELYRAWIDRDFATGEATQIIHLGLDYPFFNRVESGSSSQLFPQERASAALMSVRGVGGRYLITTPDADVGFDVMENLDPDKPTANAGHKDGLFYSARVEYAPLDAPKPRYQESWAGEPGEGLLLGLDIGYDNRDLGVAGFTTSRLGWGAEALGHFDELSVLAELRYLHQHQVPLGAGTESTLQSRVFLIQAGWAFPLADVVMEPALRLSLIDFNSGAGTQRVSYDGATTNPIADADWGDTGQQLDIGLNIYLHEHLNQLQLSYSRWEATDGGAHASIWRLQHQLSF